MKELHMIKDVYHFIINDRKTYKFSWWTVASNGVQSAKQVIIGNIEFPRKVVRDFKRRYPEGVVNYKDNYEKI